jgi:hypothetical protein
MFPKFGTIRFVALRQLSYDSVQSTFLRGATVIKLPSLRIKAGSNMQLTRWFTWIAATATIAAACSSSPALADTVYSLVDYPTLEQGWTLSGTITTDGNTGTLNPGDILAWSWKLSKSGSSDVTIDNTTGFLTPQGQTPGLFAVSGSNLILVDGQGFAAERDGYPSSTYTMFWDEIRNLSFTSGDVWNASSTNGSQTTWYYHNNATGSIPALQAGGYAIATAVPEPSTLTFLGTAFAGLGVVYLRRRARNCTGAARCRGLIPGRLV